MAPIPLTIIGVMPGHALLGAQFTATSMIGMIALAGIIVRNSILLVDFINLQVREGVPFKRGRRAARPSRARSRSLLTGLAAMLGAFFILDDPIFNGLAISLIFGILVSTLLTLVVIPLLYYVAYRNTPCPARSSTLSRRFDMTSWQLVRLFAGTFILLSLALGIPGSPIFVSPWWLAFTAFVGVNLLQSALTKWCLMETHHAQARRSAGQLKRGRSHATRLPALRHRQPRCPTSACTTHPVCGRCSTELMAAAPGAAHRRQLRRPSSPAPNCRCWSTSGPTGAARARRWRRTSNAPQRNCPTCDSPRSIPTPTRRPAQRTASAASRR